YPDGAVVVYYLYMGTEPVNLALDQFNTSSGVHVFALTPGDNGDLKSKKIKLNNVLLAMEGDNLPAMNPKLHIGDVPLSPQSYGFIVIPDAEVRLYDNDEGDDDDDDDEDDDDDNGDDDDEDDEDEDDDTDDNDDDDDDDVDDDDEEEDDDGGGVSRYSRPVPLGYRLPGVAHRCSVFWETPDLQASSRSSVISPCHKPDP
ncbi:hypothetical protein ElyMa_006607500, partial [Elysia marginata]